MDRQDLLPTTRLMRGTTPDEPARLSLTVVGATETEIQLETGLRPSAPYPSVARVAYVNSRRRGRRASALLVAGALEPEEAIVPATEVA